MEQFNITKSKKELKSAAENSDTKADLAIQIILNNMAIYNDLILGYDLGDTKKNYLIYQMSSTIFNELKEFGLVPPKVKAAGKSESSALEDIINSVNKR